MEQSKANESLMNLDEDHKREKEELHEKISQLEKLLEEKEEENEGLRDWGRILKVKERKRIEELHRVRLEPTNQRGTAEELKNAQNLAIRLAKLIDEKNQTICELEHKCDELTAEKVRLHQAFSEELRKMQFIGLQNQKLEQELEFQMRNKGFDSQEKDKPKHELVNWKETLEERTKEFENKNCENELVAASLEKEMLEPKNCNDSEKILTAQIENLKMELSDKAEELQNLESEYQVLVFKERICNDELQDARKEAIRVLRDMLNQRTTLRIKRMGEVDLKPFRKACSGKCVDGENLDEVSAKLCSSWQAKVENPHWHPFKNVVINGKHQEVIDEDGDKLKELRHECGEEAYKAVVNALLEMNEYNPSGRYIEAEIWVPKESRKATMKEIIQYIFKQWQTNKLKRKRR